MTIKFNLKKLFIFMFLNLILHVNAQDLNNKHLLKATTTFFPNVEEVNNQNIKWFNLIVPEDWENSNSTKKIKLAIAVIPCFKKSSKNTVHISGGPGGWCIGPIKKWLNHPLRNESNIILVDLRGTGFSEPSLCPKLGEEIMQVFANNLNNNINEIVNVSEQCKIDLIEKGIDIKSYNSMNISRDIHALKKALEINKWFVYGISYGTYISQVYSSQFPNDVQGIILDSPISNINQYYKNNTSNFINSLNILFKESRQKYPDLESKYYAVVNRLSKKGIRVDVEKNLVKTGSFVYNADDFKIIIHQSLYNKQLIEVIPLIINAFHNEDVAILTNLVAAFSESLKRDFGTYYCVSCNDGFNDKSIEDYDENASMFKKNNGGVSFYRSDLSVCEKWGVGIQKKNVSVQKNNNIKTLVFAGKYDPITPLSNGKEIVIKNKNSFLIEMPYGHATSFSKAGQRLVENFIKNPDKKPIVEEKLAQIEFVSNIKYNTGLSNMAKSLSKPNLLFLSPLILALAIILSAFLYYVFSIFKNKRGKLSKLEYLLMINSLLGMLLVFGFVWAIHQTSNYNFYVLLFGLPQKYNFLFIVNYVFIGITIIIVLVLPYKIKNTQNVEVIFTIVFSLALIIVYFAYWEIM